MRRTPGLQISLVAPLFVLCLSSLGFVSPAGADSAVPAALEAVACPTATHCIAVGGSGAVLVSDDGGASWADQSDASGRYLYGIACPSSTRCIAVGDAGTILISGRGRKGGQTWTRVRSGTTEPLSSVSCPEGGHCYAVGDGGTVLVSSNSGTTWDEAASGSSVIDAVDCSAPTQCAAVTSNAELDLYTQDGSNWADSNVQTAALLALAPMNAIACSGAICTAAGSHGLLARSSDRGATWSFLYPAVTAQNLNGVECPTSSRCFAVGSNGIVLTSDDGAETWTYQKSPTHQTLLGITCTTVENCIAVGNGRTVISTADGGAHWIVRNGDAEPRPTTSVLVVGDSFAHTLALYVGRDASAYGVTFVDGGLDGCDLARGDTLGNPGGKLGVVQPVVGPCGASGTGWTSIYQTLVNQYRPDLSVLVLGPWDLSTRLVDGQWLAPGEAGYDAYYKAQVESAVHILSKYGAHVVITTVPYVHSSAAEPCVPSPATVAACPSERTRVAALNAVAKKVAAGNPSRVTVVNLGGHLSSNGTYERRIDGVTVRASDGVHLSEPGGEWLTPWLLPRLLAAANS
jgi:photosystem II stability/assembly factor-like uncharacterized protein